MAADFILRCPRCGGSVPLAPPATAAGRCSDCGHAPASDGGVLVLDELAGHGDYPADVYDVIAPVEERHWWHASRNDVIARALAPERRRRGLRTALEVGCGTGFVLAHLERLGFSVCGLDMQIEGLRHARGRTGAPLVRSGRPEIPLRSRADLVALCDVLEHAEEAPLLAACRDALSPGGLLLVTVPANPALWSLEDELSGHRRRYTRASLAAALRAAGYRMVLLRPYHAVITPLAWWHRRRRGWQDRPRPKAAAFFRAALRPPSRTVSAVMRAALAVENRLGTLVSLPWGSSLLALAELAPEPHAAAGNSRAAQTP